MDFIKNISCKSFKMTMMTIGYTCDFYGNSSNSLNQYEVINNSKVHDF
jgi:hypothetical protein